MTYQRRVFAAFSVAALTAVSGAMAATPTYYAREIAGATFVEDAFAGTKVWNKAPGVTYTVRVQANARIVITGKK
jgi:hypothetical protein